MLFFRLSWMGALLLLSYASTNAAAPSTTKLEVITIFTRAHCGHPTKEPNAQLLTNEAAYSNAFADITAGQFGARPILPAVDFSHFAVLLVRMGQKRTTGYALSLARPIAEQSRDGLRLQLKWRAPAPGSITGQMITSPCILLRIPRGNFSEIQVLDQKGETRIALRLESG